MIDTMQAAHDAANATREALRATPEGRRWYATRTDQRTAPGPAIEALVAEYNRAMFASFIEMAR
jgi:hypothetical protein